MILGLNHRTSPSSFMWLLAGLQNLQGLLYDQVVGFPQSRQAKGQEKMSTMEATVFLDLVSEV